MKRRPRRTSFVTFVVGCIGVVVTYCSGTHAKEWWAERWVVVAVLIAPKVGDKRGNTVALGSGAEGSGVELTVSIIALVHPHCTFVGIVTGRHHHRVIRVVVERGPHGHDSLEEPTPIGADACLPHFSIEEPKIAILCRHEREGVNESGRKGEGEGTSPVTMTEQRR